jgi:holo-[acyl-carrier protein] synthase
MDGVRSLVANVWPVRSVNDDALRTVLPRGKYERCCHFSNKDNVGWAVTVITGFDIQSIDEVKDSIAQFGQRYLKRIYSDVELEECNGNENLARSLALRFAAKEAVIKALRPHDHIPSWRTIEVLLLLGGGPMVVLSGEAKILAHQRGIETMSLSVSATNDCAIAAVVADVTGSGASGFCDGHRCDGRSEVVE